MNHSTGKPTKAEAERMDRLREFGCIACHLDEVAEGFRYEGLADIHHMLLGGKRIGHYWTIPLCQGHHTGSLLSWHRTRRKFREIYGTDAELVTLCNQQIGWVA